MAFSQTPNLNTYTTKTIKLLNVWESRDTSASKDNELLNCFYEVITNKTTGDNEHYVVKRDGTSAYAYSAPTSNIRGFHFWEDQNKFFVAYDKNIDVITASTGATITTLSNVFTTTSGDVGFTEFYYDDTSVKVIVTDGTTLATIDPSNVFVASADPDLPAPHQPYPVFLDGYLFISKTNTADIYNSDLNTPLSFTPGDFISAEMVPDKIQRIVKLNNYIAAFGSECIEYFWDAANATGSPLQRYDTPIKYIGFQGGVAFYRNKVYFVGNPTTASPAVYVLEDLKIDEISDPVFRRYIQNQTSFRGSFVSFGGHDFYIITTGTLTYGYDLDTKKWSRWAFKAQTNFQMQDAILIPHATKGNVSLFYNLGDAQFYHFDSTVFQDGGVNFTCRIITDNEMFDTLQRKSINRLIVHGDRPSADASLSISVSDDDYKTYTTARTVNLNQSWPMLSRWGQFRRRAHKLEFSENAPMRLYKLEVEVNMDQS